MRDGVEFGGAFWSVFFVADVAAVEFCANARGGLLAIEDGVEHLQRAAEFFGERGLAEEGEPVLGASGLFCFCGVHLVE